MTSGTTACSVTATQAAGSNYGSGSVSGSVTATKVSNVVTFTTPAPASAVLSGLVVKGSFFLTLRLWFYVLPALPAQLCSGMT